MFRLPTLAVLGILAAACPAAAQTLTTDLAPVVVTGLREPQPLERVVGDIVVIDAERIRDSGATTIEDLLQRAGGIQLSRNGGAGQSAGLLLRGHSSANTVVLIDGVRMGSATLGQVDFAGIALASIERIEILRGPGSSLYGADAVGGVVQIITRRGRGAPALTAHLAAGQLGSLDASAGVRGSTGVIDYAASVGHDRSDGISAVRENDPFGRANPDRDGYRRDALALQLGVAPLAGHRVGANVQRSRLKSQYDSAEFLPPGFTPDPAYDFRSTLDTSLASLDWRGDILPWLTTSLRGSEQRDELVSGAVSVSRFDTQRRQFTWQNALRFSAGHEVVAALERLDEEVDTLAYAAPSRRTNSGVLAWSLRRAAHRVQIDARHDNSSTHGAVNTAKLAWAGDAGAGWTLRAGAGNAFRAPSFNDLYFAGYGVATLRPERSTSVEIGARWRAAASTVGVTAYRQQVRDLIAFEPDRTFCPADPSYDFGCARNVDRARMRGATIDAAHRIGAWALAATLDFLDAEDSATGARLTRRAAHQQSLGVDWSEGAWSAGAVLIGVGSRPEGGATLDVYHRLDLQARWRVAPQWRAEARVLNAGAADYEPARAYRAVWRQAWLGLRFDGAGF